MTRIALALSLTMSLAGFAQAGLEPQTEPLAVSVQRESVDTIVPIYRAYMTAGSDHKFAFIVPDNFRLGGDPAHGKLQLENTESGSLITMNFLHSPGFDSAESGKEVYRELLASRYANSKVVGEFSRPAAGQTGIGFDVQWAKESKAGSNFVQRTRAVYLPTAAGLLEMTITTTAKNANTGEANLDEILRSFAASMGGQLTVHHVGRVN